MNGLQQHPESGFVFGYRQIIDEQGSVDVAASQQIASSHAAIDPATYDYAMLLRGRGNICPPSSAIFPRSAIEQVGGFNSIFGMAEDYDMYLKIARQFSIHCHATIVVEYRHHSSSTSHQRMIHLLDDTLRALDAQKAYAEGDPTHQQAYREGRLYWQYFFTIIMLDTALRLLLKGQLARSLWRAVLTSSAFPFCLVFYVPGLLRQLLDRVKQVGQKWLLKSATQTPA